MDCYIQCNNVCITAQVLHSYTASRQISHFACIVGNEYEINEILCNMPTTIIEFYSVLLCHTPYI